jgi:hypothetical protein
MNSSDRKVIAAHLDPPTCPHCGTELNGICGDAMPSDGDFSICAYCLKMSIFAMHPTKVLLRAPATKEEKADAAKAKEELIASL